MLKSVVRDASDQRCEVAGAGNRIERGTVVRLVVAALIAVAAAVVFAVAGTTSAGAMAAADADFACSADAGDLSWTDAGQERYWVYRSTDGGEIYSWLGRSLGGTQFTDPAPVVGAKYQVHYQGIPRIGCTIVSEPAASPAFACRVDGNAVSWTDADQDLYWIYRSTDGGEVYSWLGRSLGGTQFTDPAPVVGAKYQVHYQGIPRVGCTRPSLACNADAGEITWTDAGQELYWIYRSTDGGEIYSWLGRSMGGTQFMDPAPVAFAKYQVHYQGIPRVSCASVGEPAGGANLLFASGFEGVSLGPVDDGYQRLTGTDSVTGSTWDESLGGLWGSSNNGIHLIDGGGVSGAIENELQTVVGPTGELTTAMYQEIEFSDGSPRAQTPYQINNIEDDPDEFYISYWMKLDDTSLDEDDKYRIVWQYKSDRFDYQHPEAGYRIGVYIYTDEDGAYWHVKGDDQRPDYWSVSDRDTPVPRDEWFQVEVYGKVSAGDDGRFWAKINGTEIASHDGPNLGSEADTMEFMMLWQLYSNSYPAHQWVDDIEIWDGFPY